MLPVLHGYLVKRTDDHASPQLTACALVVRVIRDILILVNLICNAQHAMLATGGLSQLWLRTGRAEDQDGLIRFQGTDTGIGIKREHLTRIFSQGFATKKDGHGFDLHSSALAAKVMGAYSACTATGKVTAQRLHTTW